MDRPSIVPVTVPKVLPVVLLKEKVKDNAVAAEADAKIPKAVTKPKSLVAIAPVSYTGAIVLGFELRKNINLFQILDWENYNRLKN